MPRNWSPIKGYEGLYEASDQGEIRRVGRRVLKPYLEPKNAYPRVSLCKNNKVRRFRVHRLVLETFRGPRPKGLWGRHLNDIRTDNRLENLEWGTAKENYEDQHKNGRWKPRGKAI